MRPITRLIVCTILLVCFVSGCTTHQQSVSVTAAYTEEVADTIRLGSIPLVSERDGLTPEGCTLVFGDRDASCITRWNAMNYDEKVSFFIGKGSVFFRGLWQQNREQGLIRQLLQEYPDKEMEEVLHMTTELISPMSALACISETRVRHHEDYCLFLMEPMATQEEVVQARIFYEQEQRALLGYE